MDYDFFGVNDQPQEKENNLQPVPAPSQEEQKPRPKKKRSIGKTILSIGIALTIFLGGMGTTWALLDPEMRTLIIVKDKIQADYYKEVSDEDFYKAIFGGINNNLLDPYSGYLTAEEFASMVSGMDGNQIGVGLAFSAQSTDPLRITRVCGNSPAEEAGVLVGETVVGVGASETSITPCSTFEEFSSFLKQYGEKEEFFLALQLNGVTRNVKLYKAAYVENYVFYRTNSTAYSFTGSSASEWTEIVSSLCVKSLFGKSIGYASFLFLALALCGGGTLFLTAKLCRGHTTLLILFELLSVIVSVFVSRKLLLGYDPRLLCNLCYAFVPLREGCKSFIIHGGTAYNSGILRGRRLSFLCHQLVPLSFSL